MTQEWRARITEVFVAAFAVAAVLAFARAQAISVVEWSIGLLAFLALAFLLDRDPSDLKHQARGSTAFLVVCALAILKGPASASVVVLATAVVGGLNERRQLVKIIFNASQHTVALCAAWVLYAALGGNLPAAFLSPGTGTVAAGLFDLVRFFAFVLAYLWINAFFVHLIIAVSTGKPLLEIWRANRRGAFSFDVSAVSVSILGAVSFTFFERWEGFGVLGLALVAVPMHGSRRSYLLLRQLQASGEELLQLMVKAIEARDPYTSGHSLRVQRLSVAIAGDLRISGRDMENVATAALLHDVGKIHEEFAPVLRKESKLTPEERALIETHAFRGFELVGVISRFRGPVQTAVLHHHERWDGAGYPAQLRGEAIPLISRIILVADTIDAMTTDRPYRARMGFDSVVAELKRHAGTQFDPDIAEVAITSLAVRRIITEPELSAKTVVREASLAAATAATAV